MINWKIETWEEIENVLEALEIDYMVTHYGNLVLHFEDFDVVCENSKKIVDHVDHLFMEFRFEPNCSSYKLKFSRTDVYYNKQEYVLPHAKTNGSGFCTGDYRTNLSLIGDIVYFMKWIRDYNKDNEYYSPPSNADLSPSHSIHSKLIPTFYMDITKGYPVVKDVELVGNVEDYIIIPKLEDTRVFYWKGEAYPKTVKGQLGKINFNQYFKYAKFIERYNQPASTLSNTNSLSEVA